MYAREYAKLKGYPYPLILRLCREGKIPSIKQQKYLIDPDEADKAIEIIKRSPKVVAKAEVKEIKDVQDPKGTYLERLKASGR